MNIYRISNRIELGDGFDSTYMSPNQMVNLLTSIIEVLRKSKGENLFDVFNWLVYDIAVKLPKNDRVERTAVLGISRLLLTHQDVILGLAESQEEIEIQHAGDAVIVIIR